MRHLSYLPPGLSRDLITNCASYHHRPDSPLQEIIRDADILSSGMEREVDDDYTGGPTSFRQVRLRAIMGEIRIPGREPTDDVRHWVHRIDELTPEHAFAFIEKTGKDSPKGKDLTHEYESLWNKFVAAWEKNNLEYLWVFINRALGILEHFTWCIPSATNVFPDISLFDHLKTTAAIAICINDAELTQEPFLLVSTDFGGIQNYIYSIRTGAGALARRLTARSFYVSLLGDAVIHRILRDLDLPMTNCLIASGGRSYLLLPNNQNARTAIEKVRNEVDQWSIRETRGEIRINLATVSLQKDGLRDFAESLEKVNAALRKEKEKPLSSCLQSSKGWVDFGQILHPIEIPTSGGLCDSCQKNGAPLRKVRDKSVPICDRCNEDQEVGRWLPRSKFIAFFDDETGRFSLPFGTFDLIEDPARIKGSPYMIFSMAGFSESRGDLPLMCGFRARHIPQGESGEILTFEELAEKSKGRKSLAYLKSDVDNLGFIFASGFMRDGRSDRTSISRVTTLSRSLDLFYSGYFDHLLTIEFPDIYTVYSGGDDLVCIGPWDRIAGVALRIREKFREYSCENSAWTLSSGVALVGPRTPVLTAIELADTMLDASKETRGEGVMPYDLETKKGVRAKDRITFFGTSIPWAKYPEVVQRSLWLTGLIASGKLNTSKVRRLLIYGEMFRSFQRAGDTRYLKYVPLLAYDLRRNWETDQSDPEVREALEWAQGFLIPESEEITGVRFMCEYALNAVREKEAQYG